MLIVNQAGGGDLKNLKRPFGPARAATTFAVSKYFIGQEIFLLRKIVRSLAL
jgi:hypothetical protein